MCVIFLISLPLLLRLCIQKPEIVMNQLTPKCNRQRNHFFFSFSSTLSSLLHSQELRENARGRKYFRDFSCSIFWYGNDTWFFFLVRPFGTNSFRDRETIFYLLARDGIIFTVPFPLPPHACTRTQRRWRKLTHKVFLSDLPVREFEMPREKRE